MSNKLTQRFGVYLPNSGNNLWDRSIRRKLMAKLFRYFDDWKSETFTCPKCGWTGTFEEGDVEIHDELMDSSCPICDYYSTPMLAIVSFPTLEESEQNWDKVSEGDKKAIIKRKRFLKKLDKMSLKSADDLPDLEGSSIIISWDCEGDEPGPDYYTVLKHGENEIWREPAAYEGYDRFREVVEILKEKYGDRLMDVEPTKGSYLYLLGDYYGADGAVQGVRSRIHDKEID
jgi:hypothetical protein